MRTVLALLPALISKTTLRSTPTALRMATTSSLPAFGTPSFGLTKTLPGVSYADAMTKTVSALKDVGFGVLTEIDVDATFQKKIDTSLDRPYKILGACNPNFAHRALQKIPAVGLLMPCNVVVTTDAESNAVVSMIDPMSLFAAVVNEPGMEDMAKEVQDALQKALDAL